VSYITKSSQIILFGGMNLDGFHGSKIYTMETKQEVVASVVKEIEI
jgi:hypothetical protein